MSNFSSQALKNGIVPDPSLTGDKLREFIDSIDPDIMGFDGPESPENLHNYDIDEKISTTPSTVENIGGGVSIIDNLTTINYSKTNNSKKFLVIHYTAGKSDNGTAARANTIYFKSEYRGASAHLFVDRNPVVYRSVPENFTAWHCGTNGRYYHAQCRNSNSIGVEICSYMENGVYKFYDDTIEHALILCRYLVKKYNIPKENVIMHYHVTHKVCAAPFMSNSVPVIAWDNFRNSIFDETKHHWCDPIRDQLLDKGIITDKVQWSNYNDAITKGLLVKLLSNIYKNEPTGTTNHWAGNAVKNLINHGVITDASQWEDLDTYISKALTLALIDKATGGTERLYVGRTADHWGRNNLDSLCDKGIISSPSDWTDFEAQVQKSLVLAIIYKSLNKIK